ncbi:hypothetical protein [Actinomadura litoris]|uniref:hypothetical protein n=1 Tax=Actinomadura litoris TaxID=2678616 RepID=UPI001FA6DA3F|nr:hypothetical protein [Actinomadura litoris]
MRLEDLPTNEDWGRSSWEEVFPGANGGDYSGTYPVGPGGTEVEDVTPERITEVLHFWAESPEGFGSQDFFAVARLTDGQYAVSEAYADTTGWGCQADAWWKVGPTYESVIAELSESNRARLDESRRR